MKFLSLFVVSAIFCAGQVCRPSPEMKTAIGKIARLPARELLDAVRELRDRNPDNLWAQLAYMASVPNHDALIAEYDRALRDHPGDVNYLYYRGSTLIANHAADAIPYLDQALEKDPGLAIAHARLVQIYGSPGFNNADRLRVHLEAFLKACPDSDLGFYRYLERMDAPDLVRECAVSLRKTLAAREDVNDMVYYRLLWTLELKAQPQAQVQTSMRQDLERLRKMGVREHPQLAETVRAGYQMLGDKEGLAWLDTATGSQAGGDFLDRTLASLTPLPDAPPPEQNAEREDKPAADAEAMTVPGEESAGAASRKELVAVNQKLPEFTLEDLAGKRWTLADLHGKATLINVWATWCGPCRKELPLLQALYDRVKDRTDIQIVTLNTDDNPRSIKPFLKKNHFTFTALPAKAYVHSVVPRLSIPRTWTVDKKGLVRYTTVGYSAGGAKTWVDRTLKSLEKLRKARD